MALAALVAVGVALVLQPGASTADVSGVTGSAYGYRAYDIVFFESPRPDTGPTPTVALSPNAANSPQTASATSGSVTLGPATLFSSGAIKVDTSGTVGPGGSVTSSASLDNVTAPLTATRVASTCTASETGRSGTTTIEGGTIQLDNGVDTNNDNDYTDAGEHPPVNQAIPTNPPAGTEYTGHLHLPGDTQDNFRVVFNEQVTSGNSITVNAVHMYLLGPGVTGHVILGQSVCGVTATGGTTSTTAGTGPTTSTTAGTGPTTSTTLGTGPTTSTTAGTGPTTSTTLGTGPTTSTTRAPSATTTTLIGSPFPDITRFITDLICGILRQIRTIPFLQPFIDPLLTSFGCSVVA